MLYLREMSHLSFLLSRTMCAQQIHNFKKFTFLNKVVLLIEVVLDGKKD